MQRTQPPGGCVSHPHPPERAAAVYQVPGVGARAESELRGGGLRDVRAGRHVHCDEVIEVGLLQAVPRHGHPGAGAVQDVW
eukprot:360488-Chlamydomonas_euryale.AAC.9